MKKTILCLSLSFVLTCVPAMSQPSDAAKESTPPITDSSETNAPALRPAIEPTAPTVETTVQSEESATKKLCKKAWKSCKGCATNSAKAAGSTVAHPLLTLKKTPGATVKTLKVCHAKALDFSDNHERDFKLIGNLTTLFGAYFFAKNSFNSFGKSTNKTVIVGQ